MTWATDRRLDYIAWRLSARGEVQRGDIMRVFGVSMAQASGDIAKFERAHPGVMEYDRTARHYRPSGHGRQRKLLAGIDWETVNKVR
jgi:hypothetical protein